MAASRRVSPAASRPPGTRSAPRARGRRRRPSLWRRALLALPSPSLPRRRDRLAELQTEIHGLRIVVSALRAEIRELQQRPVVESAPAVELPSVTLLLPLAWAALEAGVAADADLPIDLGPDTAPTEIDLRRLPEAALLDPRLAREAEGIERLLADETADVPAPELERETA
jgi:hypothetical protein